MKLNKYKGITVLISSHYLDELSKIATHYGFMDKGKIIKEINKKELEQDCKKRIEISVTNIKECEEYLKECNYSYEIISDRVINIYEKINISELVLSLSNRNCIVDEIHEQEETLENYYINLIGGAENV